MHGRTRLAIDPRIPTRSGGGVIEAATEAFAISVDARTPTGTCFFVVVFVVVVSKLSAVRGQCCFHSNELFYSILLYNIPGTEI